MRITRLALLPVAGLALAACSATPPAAAPVHTRTSSASQSASPVPGSTLPTKPVQPIKTPPGAPCNPQVMTAGTGAKTTAASTFSVTTAVKNTGTSACTIKGYPTVAITGLPPATGDWPRKQLKVVQDGPSDLVVLAPGDGAVVTLTFTQCQPGQEPTEGRVVLLGVPTGGITMTLEDGSDVIECGDVVKATAFEAHL
ncbi:DUF4232 domain-containing protein [Kutzneria chonburiensis]|uniref:DUF4232 domain-containing protein n=1 Tax=Kutzneria chonburiensis TaxID=1483604 RepID=A0ABV6MRR8_9PSEU|nr:DUF4232 domain-containing protein [Kutzneria chonburiensis]